MKKPLYDIDGIKREMISYRKTIIVVVISLNERIYLLESEIARKNVIISMLISLLPQSHHHHSY